MVKAHVGRGRAAGNFPQAQHQSITRIRLLGGQEQDVRLGNFHQAGGVARQRPGLALVA